MTGAPAAATIDVRPSDGGDAAWTLRGVGLYVLAWSPIVVLYTAAIASMGSGLRSAIDGSLTSVLPAMLLGVPVLVLARRLPDAGTAPVRAAVVHLALALTFGVVWTGVNALLLLLLAPRPVLDMYVATAAGWQAISGVFVYAAITGIGHALSTARRLREREAAAARAELHALRAQLDPHFLFNTLHSLTALARKDGTAVERGLERFGDLLRYVLDASRRGANAGATDDVALADELAFVRDYLALERLRLGERLRVEEAIEEDALECAVPAFALQPLVENAIRHGLAPRAAGGTLRLVARMPDGERLTLEVADDGVGCAPDAPAAARGLGLALVRRRLTARFGTRAALAVVTAPGQGFRAVVTLPAEVARARTGAHAAAHGVTPPLPTSRATTSTRAAAVGS